MKNAPKNSEAKSYFMLIGSMLIFGTIGIFRRYIPFSSGLLAFSRGLLGALFLVIYSLCTKKKVLGKIDKKNFLLLILTGGLIGINWIFLFEAYNYTTVATATLCYYMQPAIVIFTAPIFLKERLTLKKFICAVVSVFGMTLVSGVFSEGLLQSGQSRGIIYGLLAAAFYSSVVILNKKINIDNSIQKTLIQLISASVVLIPYLLFTEDFTQIGFSLRAGVMLLILGIFHTGIAYTLYFSSLSVLKGQSVAVLSYIDPVFALILSVSILNESFSVSGVIGAVMIIGAALFSELSFNKSK